VATLGNAAADIVALAKFDGIPIVIGRLDFEAKEAWLREERAAWPECPRPSSARGLTV